MTLAEFRGIKRPGSEEVGVGVMGAEAAGHEVAVAVPRERPHPGPLEYAKVGLALGIITAIEVGVYYMGVERWALAAMLIVLSAIKFSLVVLWFMHLRFDNRLFSMLFVGGLALAAVLFIVVLASLGAGLI